MRPVTATTPMMRAASPSEEESREPAAERPSPWASSVSPVSSEDVSAELRELAEVVSSELREDWAVAGWMEPKATAVAAMRLMMVLRMGKIMLPPRGK